MWGLKVCSVSLRGLFMGWIELALKDFIDLIRMLLALIHVWKMCVRLDSLWQCVQMTTVFKNH